MNLRLDVRDARHSFPATENLAYLNTRPFVREPHPRRDLSRLASTSDRRGLDFGKAKPRASSPGPRRGLIGADPSDVALIASVSAAADSSPRSRAGGSGRTS